MPGKNKRTRRSNINGHALENDDDDDVLELHDSGDLENDGEQLGSKWLTNKLIAEARDKAKRGRSAQTYDSEDMCVVGLERIMSIVSDEDFIVLPLATIDSQIKLVNMYHEKAFSQIIDVTDKLSAKEMLKRRDRMNKIDELHATLMAKLDNRRREIMLDEATMIQRNTSRAHHTSSTAPQMDVRMAKIEIEKFSGDVKKWPQFRSSFEDCYHNRLESGASKFYYLMAHLEENSEAYNTVCGIDRTDENYPAAWKLLCEAYDNERKIVNDIVLSFVDMPSVESPTRAGLIALVNRTNTLLQSLPKYGIKVEHWDAILVPLLIRKMDGESIRLWSLERDQRKIAELKPLLEFMRNRADGMDAEFIVRLDNSSHSYTSGTSIQKTHVTSSGEKHKQDPSKYKHDPSFVKKKRGNCYHCNGPHQLFMCQSFSRMSIPLGEERLKTLGVCIKCLRKGHSVESCRLSNCNVCGQPHNRVLCPKAKITPAVLSMVKANSSVDTIDSSLIGTLKMVVSDRNGNKTTVRAMSDGGSHMCMVSSRLVQRLKLEQTKLTVPLEGAGRFDLQAKSVVDFRVSPAENGTSQGEWIRAGVLSSISSQLPLEKFNISNWKHIEGLPLADTKFNVPDEIDLLLSVEFMARIECEGLRRDENKPELPIARKTSFGWVIYGALPSTQHFASVSHLAISDSQRITDSLEKLWQVDTIKQRPLLTPEEALCKKSFDESIRRDADGRYSVALPIKPNAPKLGNSLRAAIARQIQNESRFRKDPDLKSKYVRDIQQFIDLDHMELVPFDEIHKPDSEVYYIPHHAARTKKFRAVFDGSVKTSSGVSLNDILMNGPHGQEDLPVILMRFRKYQIALTTDITKMYRQIRVHEHQRDFQRIVWRENEGEPMRHFRLKTQTYGLKSSAFICIEALRYCAMEYKDEFPLASEAVLRCFYADDGTLGAVDDTEAETLYQQLNAMLEKGGFPLAKWATNSKHMQSVIGATAKSVDLELFNENSVLGIKWSVSDDCFKFDLNEEIQDSKPTKRFIVSSVARLYDPVGWIAPVVVLGKMLIQDVWRSKTDWDTIVSVELQRKWNEFRGTLASISQIAIPRWLGMSKETSIQMHGFSDASKKAYGVAFYIRVENGAGIKCGLVTSKTRVAPLNGMTIPRLELCGAVMMSQMCQQVCHAYDVDVANLTLWVDSSIVIHWLSKCPANMKPFVGNRIAEAQELTRGALWRHVRTQDNPADLASRGLIAPELINNSFWYNGPKWLSAVEEKWPKSEFVVDREVVEATAVEIQPFKSMIIVQKDITPRIEVEVKGKPAELLLDRCDSMMKLVRVTSRVLRFISMIRDKRKFDPTFIAREEYLRAQSVWIKYHQSKFFHRELESCTAGKLDDDNRVTNVGRESSLIKLTPFVDGDGILRVGGRIKRALMSYDTIHPIILHHSCRFSHLLALESHRNLMHGGNRACMQYIRQRFWMVNVRKAIKKVTLKCIPCFRQRKQTSTQLMGSLPSTRVRPGFAFEAVGIDYCGPISVKERNGRCRKTYKAYVAVFVCMKTKAVHLDLVTDLTSDAFMACLSRLIALRGSVHEIYSDNATTFHGSDNEQKLIFEHWRSVAVSECLQLKQVKWKFISPLSPYQGGLWERAVRSAKHHLRRVIGIQILTYEEYVTVLAQVSACLNSRPLIALDDDPTAAEALTPAHLVMGRRLIGPLQFDYTELPDNRLQRWRLIQKIGQEFWLSWQREYVTHLIERSKWSRHERNIGIGDVVLIKMDNVPPTHWPLGRICDVFPADDGAVRNVQVQIGEAKYTRGINKIAALPTEDIEE